MAKLSDRAFFKAIQVLIAENQWWDPYIPNPTPTYYLPLLRKINSATFQNGIDDLYCDVRTFYYTQANTHREPRITFIGMNTDFYICYLNQNYCHLTVRPSSEWPTKLKCSSLIWWYQHRRERWLQITNRLHTFILAPPDLHLKGPYCVIAVLIYVLV